MDNSRKDRIQRAVLEHCHETCCAHERSELSCCNRLGSKALQLQANDLCLQEADDPSLASAARPPQKASSHPHPVDGMPGAPDNPRGPKLVNANELG
eukprot:4672734-Pyramimonas_sp.AAC.1